MRFVKAFCIKKTVKIKKVFWKKLKFLYFIMPGLYKNKQKNVIMENLKRFVFVNARLLHQAMDY